MISRAAKFGPVFLATLTLLAGTSLPGCGGGGGDSNDGNDANNGNNGGGNVPVVTVVVSPSTVTLAPSATRTFSAAVTGTTNLGVTWTATGGTITTSGVYTAPATAGTYTVRATSIADPSASAVATVNVRTGVSQAVSITPPTATLVVGATQQFTADATGFSNASVVWTASGGTVSSTGLYTAPSTPGTYVVRATSAEDSSIGAESRVTVTGTFALIPNSGSLGTSETLQFAATLPNGTAADVIWTASAGSITSTGLFTAPTGNGTVTITAALRSDPTQRKTATITIVTVAVAVSPTTATVARGESFDFDATVTGASTSSAVKWTASAGTIDANGLFTAPTSGTSTTVTITATSVADPTRSATATVTLTSALPNVTVTVSPTGIQVAPGGTYDFDAGVLGSNNTSVVWSTGTGSIDSNGVLTAGSTSGTFEIRATSVVNPNRFGTVTVKVDPIPVIILPRTATTTVGNSVQFAAQVGGTGAGGTVTWTTTGGSIDSTGRYTATTTGTFTITATYTGDTSKSNTATVTVTN